MLQPDNSHLSKAFWGNGDLLVKLKITFSHFFAKYKKYKKTLQGEQNNCSALLCIVSFYCCYRLHPVGQPPFLYFVMIPKAVSTFIKEPLTPTRAGLVEMIGLYSLSPNLLKTKALIMAAY